MRTTLLMIGGVAIALVGCRVQDSPDNAAGANAAAPAAAALNLTRLDCGTIEFADMNGFFSDQPGVYPPGPGTRTDSCYLIRHGDQAMLWDTGLPGATLDKPIDQDGMKGALTVSLADQLAQLGLKPADIDIVGLSHRHSDHIGQAAQFTNARLVIGKGDFESLTDAERKPEDTLQGWRVDGAPVTLATGDVDIFGDGSVVALHLPGHTPDHLALLVNLKSGPVLLSGDLYHSAIAREKRAQPDWNDNKAKTLASMDKFEAKAKELGAKVIIQHEPDDIGKLPAFPKAAE